MRHLRAKLIVSAVLIITFFSCSQKPKSEKVLNQIPEKAVKPAMTNQKVAQNWQNTQEKNPQPVFGGTLTYVLRDEPISLNPLILTDINSYLTSYLIFESLLDVDKHLNFVPRLASMWKVSKDATKITFSLRRNVLWQDGKPFTSADVLFTYQKVIDKHIGSIRYQGLFSEVAHLSIPNDYTVEVYYKKPIASALEAWAGLPIIPKHIYSKIDIRKTSATQTPIGTGPFRFEEWKKGKFIRVSAFENYWHGRPYIDKIIFRIISSVNIGFKILQKNDIDGLEVTPTLWARYANTSNGKRNYNTYKFPTLNFYLIAWNADGKNPFFADSRVRRALTIAIDRRSIIQKLLLGLAETCTGPFSPHSWGYDHTISPLPFSPKQSGELLDKAGWVDSDMDGIRDKNGVPFKFTFNIPANNRQSEKVAAMIQYNLEMVGIKMNIVRLENAAYLERLMKRDFQASIMALALSIDPDVYPLLHSSQIKKGFNVVSYKNKRVDSLLVEGRQIFDRRKRAVIYHRIHRQVHEDQPYTFLFSKPQLYFFNKRVKNLKTCPQPLYLFFPGILDWFIEQ